MITRSACAAFLGISVLASAGSAQVTCPAGAAPVGGIGVGLYHCVGGVCWISDGPVRRHLDFSTEPRLRDIDGLTDPGSIREGDVLLAIDGTPITVPSAGRRLANLAVGESVVLTLRRGERVLEVGVRARAACSIGSLAVTSDTSYPALRPAAPAPPSLQTSPPPPPPPAPPDRRLANSGRIEHLRVRPNAGSLGFAIACDHCGWVIDEAGSHRWQAHQEPVLRHIDTAGPAARAGLQPSDILTHIDDEAITSREGSDRLADVRSGSTYRLRVRRGTRVIVADIVAVPVER